MILTMKLSGSERRAVFILVELTKCTHQNVRTIRNSDPTPSIVYVYNYPKGIRLETLSLYRTNGQCLQW